MSITENHAVNVAGKRKSGDFRSEGTPPPCSGTRQDEPREISIFGRAILGQIAAALTAITLLGVIASECSADLIKGVIKDLDAEHGTITLFVGGKGAEIKIIKGKVFKGSDPSDKPQVFNLKSPNIPVLLADGKKAKLTDLKPGVPVTMQLSDDDDVEAIVAGAAARGGTLIALELNKKQLTLDGGKKGVSATYTFIDDVAVTVHGHKKSPRELGVGQHLLLLMSLDQKNAVSIIAGLKRTSDDPRGVVVGVDTAQHSITLLVGRDGVHRFATWPVAADFHLVFNEVERPAAKLSELHVAASLTDLLRAPPVWLRLGQDQKSASTIVVEPAIAPAVIESIDPVKRTLVARMSNGKSESFIIEQDADIRLGSKRTELQNLTAGMQALLTLAFEPGRLLGIRGKKE